jgi:fibronectin-binding autotransporter adhesin
MSPRHHHTARSFVCGVLCAWAAVTAPSAALGQTSGTWISTSGGSWGTQANWASSIIADGTGATANFSTLDITGVQTITLDSPRTSGTLLFGDTTGTNGGWTLTSGTLRLATVSGTPTIDVANLGSQVVTISSVITGTQGLNKTGAGTLTLSASNSYSGVTTLNSGIVRVTHGSALGSGAVSSNGTGRIDLANSITVSNNFTSGGSSNPVMWSVSGSNTWAGNIAINNTRVGAAANTVLVLGGTISGVNWINRSDDTGVVVVTGTANTYTGATQAASGVLSVNSIGNWGAGPTALGAQTTLANGQIQIGIQTVRGALLYTGTGETTNRQINLIGTTGGAVIDQSGSGLLKFSADFVAGGAGSKTLTLQGSTAGVGEIAGSIIDNSATNKTSVTKAGTGTWILSGSNTYTGTTTLAGGVIALGNANALPSSGTVTFTGGSLQYSSSNTADIAARIVSSTSAIAIDTNGQNVTWAGNLASTNTGGLTKRGAGSLTLSGSSTLTGPITIAGGSLVLTNVNALNPSGAFAYTIDSGTLVSAANATGSLAGFGFGSVSIGPGGATIRSDLRADNFTVISGTSPTASLTYGTSSGTVSGVIMVIGGTNTYAGGTKIESGIDMVVDNNSAFGTGTLDLAGARIRSRSGPPRTLANAVTISANTQFFGLANEPNLTFTGATLLSGGSRTLQVDSVITSGTSAGQPGVIFSSAIGDGGNGYGITKTGAGVLALGGANTYTGATTVNAGTLQLRHQAALQFSTLSLSGTGGVVFDSVVAGNAFTFGGLSSSNSAATLALRNSAAAAIGLTIGGNNASTIYAGTLTGLGSLVKTGTGKVTLSGNNSYAGTTTVSNGVLAVNGNQSSALGAFSVAAGATLMGSGTIGGATTVQGLHSPGNSPGIQTFVGDLTYSGGSSSVLWELTANTISNSPLAFDQIIVGGNLDFASLTTLSLAFNSAGSTVSWSDAFWDTARTWTIYSVTGTTTNFGNLTLAGSPGSWLDAQSTPQSLASARPDASFSIVQDGNNVNLVYAIVPEPAAVALAGIGIVVAIGAAARKRRLASIVARAQIRS